MRLYVVIACLSAAWPMGAYADRSLAQMPVTVVVQPSASLVVTRQPSAVAVIASDIERGHKTLSLRYRISGKSPGGVLLRIDPRVGITESIAILGLPGPVTVGQHPVSVVLGADRDLDLQVVWKLAPNAAAGTYPLPLRLSVTPLAST